MSGTRNWAKDLNQKNRAFWAVEIAKAQRRLADPVLLERATADLDSETKRLIPLPFQKSFEQALQDAETLFENPALKQRAHRQLSKGGGSAKKTDKLQAIILSRVRLNPGVTEQELLRHLRDLEGAGVIQDVDDEVVHFTNHGQRTKTARVSGLKDRLWRAKKAVQGS